MGIHVRELNATLGEREIFPSPSVRVRSLDGGGMGGVATFLMLEELGKEDRGQDLPDVRPDGGDQYWFYNSQLDRYKLHGG